MAQTNLEIQGYNFEVKPWNYGEKQRALRAALKWNKKKGGKDGEVEADIDPWNLNDQMIIICVKKWDLVHPVTGKELPINIESLHEVRPPEIIEELLDEIQKINGVTIEERKKS